MNAARGQGSGRRLHPPGTQAPVGGSVGVVFEQGVVHYRYANGVVVHGCPYPGGGPGGSGGARFVGSDEHVLDLLQRAVASPESERGAARSALQRLAGGDVLCKVTQHAMGCGLCLRLTTPDGSPVEGLRVDLVGAVSAQGLPHTKARSHEGEGNNSGRGVAGGATASESHGRPRLLPLR